MESWAASDPDTAVGQSLDNLLSLFGVPREEDEADAVYWLRAQKLRGLRGLGFEENLRARLVALDFVDDARVYNNATTAPMTSNELTVPAASIAVVVRHGTIDADQQQLLAQTIVDERSSGCPLYGTTTIQFARDELAVPYIHGDAQRMVITVSANLYRPRSDTITQDVTKSLLSAVNRLQNW